VERPDWLVRFGRRLMLARGRAGLTQQQLAAPDLTKSFISLLEGGRSYPSVETVIALARRTHTSMASLLLEREDLRLETALNLLHLAWEMDPVGRGQEAVRLAAAAEALLPDMPAELRVCALLVRARAAMAAGRMGEAARRADDAAALANRHRLGIALGQALAVKGIVEERRGAFEQAVPILEKAVELMRRTRSARTVESVRALLTLGAALAGRGRFVRARRAYRRALELAERLRAPGLRGRALTGLGLVEWSHRRLDRAVDFLSKAYDALEQAEDLAEMSRALNNLGLIRREQGLYAEALTVLEKSLRIKERLKDARGRGVTLDEIARVLLAMERCGEAARAARRAIEDARAAGDRGREAAAQVTLARVLRAQGRRRAAIDLLRRAVATLTRLGMAEEAASASAELSSMPAGTGRAAVAARDPAKPLPIPAARVLGSSAGASDPEPRL
jgi:tetratricopeptide (TPR) repeat protein